MSPVTQKRRNTRLGSYPEITISKAASIARSYNWARDTRNVWLTKLIFHPWVIRARALSTFFLAILDSLFNKFIFHCFFAEQTL